MSKLVLGLDIGITSVGYGVIDLDDSSIVDYGVRLFKEGTAANNETRREKRSGRRLKRRQKTRIDDLKNLLTKNDLFYNNPSNLLSPYDCRIKGLSQKLTNEELNVALFHICKNRGSSLETVEDDDAKSKELGETKKVLQENDRLLKEGLFICQIQKKKLEENGKIRGNSNNFRTKDYVTELNKILSNQGLSEQLNKEIIEMIIRRRHFDEGPGSEKSPTKYGQWYIENGELKHIGMIEKMRGKCSIYPTELRAAKMAYSSDLFNLLNDLNNLMISDEKITTEQKEEVINIINNKGSITPKQLAKLLEVEIEEISGFRIDKNEEPLLTKFEGYKSIKKIFTENSQEDLIEDKLLVDNIIEILTNTKVVQERMDQIEKLNPTLSKSTIKDLSALNKIKGYHSLSAKAIREINKELLNSELNQMQILHSSNLMNQTNASHKGKKIFADDTAILSPVAKRAQRETMKVINRLREIYGEFDSIVVETTRDKNSDEKKKRIRDNQKFFETQNKKVIEAIGEDTKINAKLKEKIRLYLDQDGKCAYTLQPMNIVDIINDPYAYEVDHIIPISVSLDDSYNNKVLVTHKANQEKGNLTPITAFNRGLLTGCSKEAFIANAFTLKKTNKITKKKLEYLLLDKDITKFDVMKQFINRNLVDTSYANRVVFNTLNTYFKQNNIDTKVHTIRGSATSQFRKRIKLDKLREENYGHHAIDAIIVASLKKQGVINNLLKEFNIDDIYNHDTGEIYEITSEEKYFDSSYIAFLAGLKNLTVRKFSHKIDTKPNRQVADETIYSTRMINDEEKVIKKYKDIYDPKFTALAEDILNDKYQDKYLMAMHNPQTFEKIIEIVRNYFEMYKANDEFIKVEIKKDKKIYSIKGENPLSEYKKEFGMIRKYSKKGDGPYITQMKYVDGNLGNHLPISQNYPVKNKNVVLLQLSPYRTDFYKSKDGLYKFVTIRYKDVAYSLTKEKYIIDSIWYEDEKKKKKIDSNDEFQFSMHRDEIIGFVKKPGEKWIYCDDNHSSDTKHDGVTAELLKFTATNNDNKNLIEVKPINKYEVERIKPPIGKSILELKKYSTDVLGNMYEVKNSVLKLEF